MEKFVIPDHLRTGLFGWSWTKSLWPGKKELKDPLSKKNLLVLEEALMEEPTAEHFLARARFFIEHGELEKALADYNQTINEKHSLHQAIAERADVYLLLEMDDEALKDYEECLAIIPKEKTITLKLSYVCMLLGKFPEAQMYLQGYNEKVKGDTNAKLLEKYLLNFKRRMHTEIGLAELKLKESYSEENLLARAKAREKAFDLVGAAEDFLMLYLLFEKEEYRIAGQEIKSIILDLKLGRKHRS